MNKNNLNVKLLSCEICGKQSESRNYNVVSCPILYQKVVNCKRNKKCDIINGDKCRGCRFDKCLIEGMDPLLIKIDDINCRNEFIEMLEKRRNKLQQTKSTDLYHQEDQKTIFVKNNKNFNEYKQSTSNQDICISNELCFNDTTIGIILFNKKVVSGEAAQLAKKGLYVIKVFYVLHTWTNLRPLVLNQDFLNFFLVLHCKVMDQKTSTNSNHDPDSAPSSY
uniref:Nuclear receptor domain-containing protein n=1 Tax=Meloidogyne incognita TaxID=6306 RepID=A0A914NJQ3_MELIC